MEVSASQSPPQKFLCEMFTKILMFIRSWYGAVGILKAFTMTTSTRMGRVVYSLMNFMARMHLLFFLGTGAVERRELLKSKTLPTDWLSSSFFAKSTGAMMTSCVRLKSNRVLIPWGSPGNFGYNSSLPYLFLLAAEKNNKTMPFSAVERKTCKNDWGTSGDNWLISLPPQWIDT